MAEKKLTINNGNGNPESPIIVEGVINQKDQKFVKFWIGTEAEYNSTVTTPDAHTLYVIKHNT